MQELVLFIGDSITDCKRDREDDASLGSGYASFAVPRLSLDAPGKYRFLNRGIGGNCLFDILPRLEKDVIQNKPDYMSILAGANDCSLGSMARISDLAKRYEGLYCLCIEKCRDALPELRMFILSPFLLPHPQLDITYESFPYLSGKVLCEQMDELAQTAGKVAEKYSLPFVNLHDKFREALKMAPAEYWSHDGYHPTVAGHELIAREWRKIFD
ncbi:MAG: hypothetical protein IJF32_09035, partial [Oscillospiraceae bacterium]|nr:hypothetical protein [Oscillospiraceae bacterium]